MQTAPYPDVPPDFGHWFAGFVDGEGCFGIERAGGGDRTISWSCRLGILLRDDDRPILDEIARTTGIGYVLQKRRIIEGSNPGATWRASTKADCFAVARLFDRYPLRAKKARDYAIWREAVIEWGRFKRVGRTRRGDGRDWSRMEALASALKEGRTYQGSVLPEPVEDDSVAAGVDLPLF